MRTSVPLWALFAACLLAVSAAAQASVVINDPTVEADKFELSDIERSLFEKSLIPVAKEHLSYDVCEELTPEITGRAEGAFTRAGARQVVLFYQFCQTGNGLGNVGVAVIENGKVVAHYVSEEAGWSDRAVALPDIDQNGLDEIGLYFNGGMHQGAGGSGVDIMQVTKGRLTNLGWFQTEEYTDTSPVKGYKIVAKPGKTLTFTREKFIQNSSGKWRKAGTPITIKMQPADIKFETVK